MIVGAGFAGLIAAHIFPHMHIIESAEEPRQMHRALLRFRTDAVARLTGVEFKRVRVHKGIFFEGAFHAPNIALANRHSVKCLGMLRGDRSIWNVESVDRYVAPSSFYEQLIETAADRITWAAPFNFNAKVSSPLINTSPLPVALWALEDGGGLSSLAFHRERITVQRFTIASAEAYQTIYFPSPDHSMYRASITGDLLIVEFMGVPEGDWERELFEAFGFFGEVTALDTVSQSFGKIVPIEEETRKAIIHRLSVERNIYSLGRFATWRNILLDDVVQDAAIIKRLIHSAPYVRQLAAI